MTKEMLFSGRSLMATLIVLLLASLGRPVAAAPLEVPQHETQCGAVPGVVSRCQVACDTEIEGPHGNRGLCLEQCRYGADALTPPPEGWLVCAPDHDCGRGQICHVGLAATESGAACFDICNPDDAASVPTMRGQLRKLLRGLR